MTKDQGNLVIGLLLILIGQTETSGIWWKSGWYLIAGIFLLLSSFDHDVFTSVTRKG
jgi:hypothetical protein